jgi:hypothetical protein
VRGVGGNQAKLTAHDFAGIKADSDEQKDDEIAA